MPTPTIAEVIIQLEKFNTVPITSVEASYAIFILKQATTLSDDTINSFFRFLDKSCIDKQLDITLNELSFHTTLRQAKLAVIASRPSNKKHFTYDEQIEPNDLKNVRPYSQEEKTRGAIFQHKASVSFFCPQPSRSPLGEIEAQLTGNNLKDSITLLSIAQRSFQSAKLILENETLRKCLLNRNGSQNCSTLVGIAYSSFNSAKFILETEILRPYVLKMIRNDFLQIALSNHFSARLILETNAWRTVLLTGKVEEVSDCLSLIAQSSILSAKYILDSEVLHERLLYTAICDIACSSPWIAIYIFETEVLRSRLLDERIVNASLEKVAIAYRDDEAIQALCRKYQPSSVQSSTLNAHISTTSSLSMTEQATMTFPTSTVITKASTSSTNSSPSETTISNMASSTRGSSTPAQQTATLATASSTNNSGIKQKRCQVITNCLMKALLRLSPFVHKPAAITGTAHEPPDSMLSAKKSK